VPAGLWQAQATQERWGEGGGWSWFGEFGDGVKGDGG